MSGDADKHTNDFRKLLVELRRSTGAGLIKCKDALDAAGGNLEEAMMNLRKTGQADARKRSSNVTEAGVVAVTVDELKAGMVQLCSETDFVARNENCTSLAKTLSHLYCDTQVDGNTALEQQPSGSWDKAQDLISEAKVRLRENIVLGSVKCLDFSGKRGVLSYYVHQQLAPDVGSKAAVVYLESSAGPEANLLEIGKQIAMHIVAFRPEVVHVEDLSKEQLEKEREIYHAQSKDKAKNEVILEKMVEGRLKKYYQEVVLNEQTFAMDNSVSVGGFVASMAKKINFDIKIGGFILLDLSAK